MTTVHTLNAANKYKIGDIVMTTAGDRLKVVLTHDFTGARFKPAEIANSLFRHMVDNYLNSGGYAGWSKQDAERAAKADLANKDMKLTYDFDTWFGNPHVYDIPFDFSNKIFKPTIKYEEAIDLSGGDAKAVNMRSQITTLFQEAAKRAIF